MSETTHFLSVAHVIGLYFEAMRLAGERPAALVRPEVLKSAVHRPRAAAYYGGATLIEQAVELAEGIALAHPWVDGNKRCAFISMVTFLERNGVSVPDPDDERYLHVAAPLVDLVAATGDQRETRKQALVDELNGWATAAGRA
jgi:death on curing protein